MGKKKIRDLDDHVGIGVEENSNTMIKIIIFAAVLLIVGILICFAMSWNSYDPATNRGGPPNTAYTARPLSYVVNHLLYDMTDIVYSAGRPIGQAHVS